MAEEVGFEPTFAFTKTVFLTTLTFMSHFSLKCCGLDYIFTISGVSRIVSEDPTNIIMPFQITLDIKLFPISYIA